MGFMSGMGIELGTYILVASIFLLLLTGQPLAWVTGLVALIFTFGWFGGTALPLVTSRIFGFITEYSLVAIPMFILMAALLDRSGIAKDLFNGMRVLTRRCGHSNPGRVDPDGGHVRGDRRRNCAAGHSGAAANAPAWL